MRRIIAIPVIILVLFTGITVNVASHYCGGSFIASKISLSGELASCGMDHAGHKNHGIHETDHSCQDYTSSYTFSGTYLPSSLNVIDHNHLFQHTGFYSDILLTYTPQISRPHEVIRPPGARGTREVDLEVICVFRI